MPGRISKGKGSVPGGRRGRTARTQEKTIEPIRLEQGAPGPVTPFLLLPQEIPHLTGENQQVTFDDTPDNLIRNSCVAMDQAVPECDDQGCIGDLPLEVRLSPQKLVQRFADDPKLPLHRKTGAWGRRDTPRRSCRR